ncbi:MAG: hypothetical protein ACREJ2_02585 [Planctomycetota bacterium]
MRLRPAARVLQAIFAASALLTLAQMLAVPARGFNRQHTNNPTPGAGPALYWDGSTLPVRFQFNPTPPTGLADTASWFAALKRALATWMTLPTSDLTACCEGTTSSTAFVAGDGNQVFALNSAWDGPVGSVDLTRVDFVLSTGQITGADVKFNGDTFTWTDSYGPERAATGGDTAYDLESVAAHEFGLVWGFANSLDNTGVNPGDANYDDNGTPGDTSDDQINGPNQNTMDPKTIPGETYQRSLATDDIAAMDAVYGSAAVTLSQPAVFLETPAAAGESASAGSYTIQFLSQYEGPTTPMIALYYTTDPSVAAVASLAGATRIVNGLAGLKSGALQSYTWTLQNVPAGTYYLIAVTYADGQATRDLSAGTVTVPAPSLTLTAPDAAGITMNPFQNYTVTWTQTGSAFGGVNIEMSRDDGAHWQRTVAASAAATGSYTFLAPDPRAAFNLAGPLTQCRIRIAYTGNPAIQSVSSNPFTLNADSNSLTLDSPNGGETLVAGSVATVSFDANGAAVGNDFEIYWSTDGGAHWAPITLGVHLTGANPRSFSWTVPGQPGGDNLIQVFSLDAPQYYAVSASPFTIQAAAYKTFTTYPTQLIFDAVQGGGNPPDQQFNLRNAGLFLLSDCSVAVTGDSNVSVTPHTAITVGPAPDFDTLTVHVNNIYSSAGSYTANLVFTSFAGDATNEGYTLPVTVNVHATGATAALSFTPATLTFQGDPDALPPGAQTILAVNPNGNVDTQVDLYPDDLDILVKPGRFDLAAGDATPGGPDEQTITVVGDTSSLAAGEHFTGHIYTVATDIGTATLPVKFQMSGQAAGTQSSGCDLALGRNGGAAANGAAWLLMLATLLIGWACGRVRRAQGVRASETGRPSGWAESARPAEAGEPGRPS